MLAKGPELRMEINEPQPSGGEFSHGIIRINIFKGKGKVFKDDIHISNLDTQKIKRFIIKKTLAYRIELIFKTIFQDLCQ